MKSRKLTSRRVAEIPNVLMEPVPGADECRTNTQSNILFESVPGADDKENLVKSSISFIQTTQSAPRTALSF